ncbi:hypothetical protein JW949_02525 [Candidatus Woesearchaeota archaeon]|jgi:hypothetical protein|nr:hypothetical protein [Candidatus Woesearchaeota archaeon]
MAKKKSKIKKNILSISIMIIFVLFIGYGIETFYSSPKYYDFCNYSRFYDEMDYKDLNDSASIKEQEACFNEYDNVREIYNRNVFIITLIIGLSALLAGALILQSESVSSGIMGGGILTIIYGTLVFWGNMSKYIRFIILAFVLALLIWLGYKKFKD